MPKLPPETNPFVYALEIKGIWRMHKENKSINDSEGSKITHSCILIDAENRASVFPDHLLKWFSNLPSCAKDMVMYIAAKLPFNKDVLEMNEEDYMIAMEVSRPTYFNAKLALTNRLIIPRTSRKNTYWVNPAYLFKGNRIDAYRDKVIPTNECPLKSIPM